MSAATGLVSVHLLVLFAYSFPLNRPAPARVRWPLNAATAGFIALALGRSPAPTRGS